MVAPLPAALVERTQACAVSYGLNRRAAGVAQALRYGTRRWPDRKLEQDIQVGSRA